jgi:hypothetical protein
LPSVFVEQLGSKAIFYLELIAMPGHWLSRIHLLLWLGLAVTIALAFTEFLAR